MSSVGVLLTRGSDINSLPTPTMKVLPPKSLHAIDESRTQLSDLIDEISQIGANEELHTRIKFWEQTADYSVARDVLIAAGGSISHAATKYSLVLKDYPDPEACSGVCSAIVDPCSKIVLAVRICLSCGTVSVLSEFIVKSILHILNAVKELISTSFESKFELLPSLTGRVWELCDRLQHIPRSNMIATKRNLMEFVAICKDTVEELEGMIQESETSRFQEQSIEEIEDLLEYDELLVESEIPRAKCLLSIIQMVLAISKKGVLSVSAIPKTSDGFIDEEYQVWIIRLLQSYAKMSAAVIDIAPSVYTPHDLNELPQQLSSLEESAKFCLETLQSLPSIDNSLWNELNNGLAKVTQKVQECSSLCEVDIP